MRSSSTRFITSSRLWAMSTPSPAPPPPAQGRRVHPAPVGGADRAHPLQGLRQAEVADLPADELDEAAVLAVESHHGDLTARPTLAVQIGLHAVLSARVASQDST